MCLLFAGPHDILNKKKANSGKDVRYAKGSDQ